MVTLLDIAKNLKLSKTTVSKALNYSSDISSETRERVQAEAHRIGYTKTPRKNARRNSLIGIVCPEVTSYHYAQIITLLTMHLQKKGYETLVALSNFSAEMEATHFSNLVQLNVAGIILVTEQAGSNPAFHLSSIPTVIIGLNCEFENCDAVSIDEQRGIQVIVDHLIEQNHHLIAFLGDRLVNQRLDYLKEALLAKGLHLPDEYSILSDERAEQCGYEGAQKLLALPVRPTAIIAGYDTIALGAYRALCEQAVRIPEDMALVGFDDSTFCAYLPTSMSSVSYDVTTECRVAVAILMGRIHEGNVHAAQTVRIIPKLQIRESSSGQNVLVNK